MPSVRAIVQGLFAIAPIIAALPAGDVLKRQATSSALSSSISSTSTATSTAAAVSATSSTPAQAPTMQSGLTDVDILQFALTAEHLESTFYSMGFAKFSQSDFTAAGLSDTQISELKTVGMTEATHVTTLMGAIAAAGAQPVQPCTYNFDAALSDAKTMVATARVLEAVGVSAYLGAAPLVNSSDVLTAAATIVTVEARHQAFIRMASNAVPVPAAFDTPLQPRAVFTLASQFITSCPQGSNLNIQAFPAIALQNASQATVGSNLQLAGSAPPGAQFCAFVAPGGTQYSQISNNNCQIPQNLSGEVYMMITKSQSVADAEVLAGPSVIQPS